MGNLFIIIIFIILSTSWPIYRDKLKSIIISFILLIKDSPIIINILVIKKKKI